MDASYAKYAFFWTVGSVTAPRNGQDVCSTASPSARGPTHMTRSLSQSQIQPAGSQASLPWQPSGGNFFAAGVRVLAVHAPHTLCAFRPGEPHGTTVADGVKPCGLSIAFSEHIKKAYDRAVTEGIAIEPVDIL